MTTVKERPALMHARSMLGILSGRKVQTRRIAKIPDYVHLTEAPQAKRGEPMKHDAPYFDAYCGEKKTDINPRGISDFWCWWDEYDRQGIGLKCPYGKPGERLWVREAWCFHDPGLGAGPKSQHLDMKARDIPPELSDYWRKQLRFFADGDFAIDEHDLKWRPSIHMPRWASRLTLEITDVRVERVQDISSEDCFAEGVRILDESMPYANGEAYRRLFESLWDDTNGKGSWESNPFVWVISFRRLP